MPPSSPSSPPDLEAYPLRAHSRSASNVSSTSAAPSPTSTPPRPSSRGEALLAELRQDPLQVSEKTVLSLAVRWILFALAVWFLVDGAANPGIWFGVAMVLPAVVVGVVRAVGGKTMDSLRRWTT